MKFMKLGTKPDQFQTDGDNIRYVATELATDVIINVGDVKFYLHKFPLLSKSSRLQNLTQQNDADEEIDLHEVPGGPASFELCAKFCYGMSVTLNAYNAVASLCAAEYLGMHESAEKGNLVQKVDAFLSSCVLRSWKDSVVALQTTRSLLPWSEDLKIVSRCLDSVAARACTDPERVHWSYNYNYEKLPSEKKPSIVAKDWWVEDLCELHVDLYERVIAALKGKGKVTSDVVGESLSAYASRRLPIFFGRGVDVNATEKHRRLVETLARLVPGERNSAPCGFLIRLLHASMVLGCGEDLRGWLAERVARQLEEAAVGDFLIRCPNGETGVYGVDLVRNLVERFLMRERSGENDFLTSGGEFSSSDDDSKGRVARLVDGYLAEASRDPSLPLSKFLELSHLVSSFPRTTHDGIYRAVDMYLKEHPETSKGDKKRICRLMDCKKLSPEACAHAVQNERLPLRVVVQVLFFEQARAASSNGSTTPDLSGSMRTAAVPGGSFGSSRTGGTTTDDDWEGEQQAASEEELKREMGSLKVRQNGGGGGKKVAAAAAKVFSRLWSTGKGRGGGESSNSSDTSESPAASAGGEEVARCTPSRNTRRQQSLVLGP